MLIISSLLAFPPPPPTSSPFLPLLLIITIITSLHNPCRPGLYLILSFQLLCDLRKAINLKNLTCTWLSPPLTLLGGED